MIHYKQVVNRLSGTCVIFKKKTKKVLDLLVMLLYIMSFLFSLNIQTKGQRPIFWPGSTPATWFSEKCSTFLRPCAQPWQLGSQREQTGLKRAGESRVHVSDSSGQASDVTATVMAPWEAGDSGCWERALRYSGSESRLTNTNWLHCYVSFGW